MNTCLPIDHGSSFNLQMIRNISSSSYLNQEEIENEPETTEGIPAKIRMLQREQYRQSPSTL